VRTFVLYRRAIPQARAVNVVANPPDEPQLEGVEFSDGTVCVRWLTPNASHSLWPDFATFDIVHGHPGYDSEIVWTAEIIHKPS
jgi:hypothetical protein